ncbi:cytochrome c oxidase subunit II [Sunxiuqinia dokdonensis]|uniref:Cytochrome c oxidase subunit 2 n=1 Tax=Sunxiuqinia dokdonensis TaxID=1409788 RepID=A0A0L8VAT1_9BACT|nr:cytochrome c oxidase subunit II [Sunxiuqinia dokdonensis]KOH45585.1 cytochrome-c oxidase [Sunxiuqinia dokdonensis]
MYILASTQASNFVTGVDRAFIFILAVSFFFLIALTAVMIYFIFKYNRKRHPKAVQIKGSSLLELVWTVIPTILVLIMFYYGWAGWKPMKTAPDDSFEITVVGRMWNFTFEYDNGRRTDTLFVPKDQPVKLNLRSMDVIHSVFIPAFRVKEDVVPGSEKFMWFTPTNEGIYELFCTEYCGLQHSYMYNWVKVMPQDDFNKWYTDTTQQVASAEVDSPAAAGKRIMTNIGCFACHSIDGSKIIGPSFKGIYGHEVTVKTGGSERTITVDDEYIKRSIYEPEADIVDGFNKGLMQSYQGQLSDSDVEQIIEYLKTLQ